MYCIRLNIFFLFSFIFIACEGSETNDEYNFNNDFYDNNVAAFYNHYDGVSKQLSVYLEFLDTIENIESIYGEINNSEQILYEFDVPALDINSNVFLYEGILVDNNNQSILSDNIYLYTMNITILFSDNSIYTFTSDLTTPIDPYIIDYSLPNQFQLDSTSWKSLLIDLEIKDLNGFNNIESVKYEIKTTLLNGCDIDCIIDDNCNEDIISEDYNSDDTWIFDYTNSLTDTTYNYSEEILLRPLDGSALYDEDGNIIFNATDCGRTGIIEFKFIVIDKDGLSDELDGIIMEIIQ